VSGDEEEPTSDFRDALKDVKPLDRGRLRPEPKPSLRPRAAGPGAAAREVVFEIERAGEQVAGLARGDDRKRLAKLRRGEPAPERTIDLHGMDAAAARAALRRGLARALADGLRCVLVIHGRGLHSEAGPVLKPELSGWLAEPPHGPRVVAFATARPPDGGPGASYVLLRRRR